MTVKYFDYNPDTQELIPSDRYKYEAAKAKHDGYPDYWYLVKGNQDSPHRADRVTTLMRGYSCGDLPTPFVTFYGKDELLPRNVRGECQLPESHNATAQEALRVDLRFREEIGEIDNFIREVRQRMETVFRHAVEHDPYYDFSIANIEKIEPGFNLFGFGDSQYGDAVIVTFKNKQPPVAIGWDFVEFPLPDFYDRNYRRHPDSI
jgi:hypothetical protein